MMGLTKAARKFLRTKKIINCVLYQPSKNEGILVLPSLAKYQTKDGMWYAEVIEDTATLHQCLMNEKGKKMHEWKDKSLEATE